MARAGVCTSIECRLSRQRRRAACLKSRTCASLTMSLQAHRVTQASWPTRSGSS